MHEPAAGLQPVCVGHVPDAAIVRCHPGGQKESRGLGDCHQEGIPLHHRVDGHHMPAGVDFPAKHRTPVWLR